MDLISADVYFSEGPFEELPVSGGSGGTVESEWTRKARSGGWSFPMEGLACKKNSYILLYVC